MGESKDWKRRFFENHPVCCFCGGSNIATTLDHQPGRLFFKRREWPEEFVFPACEQCNCVSRQSEKALGVIIHGTGEKDNRVQFQKNLLSFKNEFPGEIEQMLFSTIEKRRLFKNYNLEKMRGHSFSEIPIISLNFDFWEPHLEIFARKLLLAVHYQHFGRPIPPEGGTYSAVFTNFEDMIGQFPKELIESAANYVGPMRNGKRLDDQFAVRFSAVASDVDAAFFLMHFHNRLIIAGVTTAERSSLDMEADLSPPFRWP